MAYVIGIDAGGTKTVGLLADEAETIHATARGPGANLVLLGELGVEKVLFQLLEDLAPPGPVAALCLGMAGAGRATEQELLGGVLRRLGHRDRVRIVGDAAVALVAGAPEGVGVVVIAGTGSIAYGVGSDGTVARSGGWGYLLGDEGSAFWLGHAAVRQGIRASDGRGPATTLLDRIAERLGVALPHGLVEWFYEEGRSHRRVAGLASVVEEAARDGDPIAERLLDEAAGHLSRAAAAVTGRLSFEETYPLVLAGGAFKACPSLYERFESRVEDERARIVRLAVEPARGAVRLALQMLG